MANEADLIVCAWGGNHKGIPDWVDSLGRLHYLELCDDGITPKHPLGNLSKDLVPINYNDIQTKYELIWIIIISGRNFMLSLPGFFYVHFVFKFERWKGVNSIN